MWLAIEYCPASDWAELSKPLDEVDDAELGATAS